MTKRNQTRIEALVKVLSSTVKAIMKDASVQYAAAFGDACDAVEIVFPGMIADVVGTSGKASTNRMIEICHQVEMFVKGEVPA